MRFQRSHLARFETVSGGDDERILQERGESSPNFAIDPGYHQVEIGMALQSVTSHELMRKSPKLQAFLTFVVSETLAGRGGRLKAYSIAVAALGKHSGFDPATDPIVRVEASRLRRCLDVYYATDGKDDPIRITMPTGSYQPIFARRTANLKIVKAVQSFERKTDPTDFGEFAHEIPTPFDILSARRTIWDDLSRVLTPRMPRIILIVNTGMMVFTILFGFKVLFVIENMDKQLNQFQKYWAAHLASHNQ